MSNEPVEIGPDNLADIFDITAFSKSGEGINSRWCSFSDPTMYLILDLSDSNTMAVNTLTTNDRYADVAMWSYSVLSNTKLKFGDNIIDYNLRNDTLKIIGFSNFTRCTTSKMYDKDTQL